MTMKTPDVAPPSGAVTGLAPSRVRLTNGLVVVAKETRKTPAVTINLAIRAGSICDPDTGLGAMHLLSRVIDRGTSSRSTAEIAETLDGCGISLAVSVTRHLFSLSCTCLADDFDDILALLGDIVMAPSLPQLEVELRKGEVVTALRQDEDNPAVRAVERLMVLLYGEAHPYGRRAKGTIESIESLSREHLRALHEARFAPSLVTLVVVGEVPVARAVESADRVFGGWKPSDPPALVLPAARTATERRVAVIPMMNKAQADVAYGFTTLTRADPDYYKLSLLNNVLGQYAMGGRLGDNIRERQGMAYYVSSTLDANLLEGPLVIRAGVSAANVDRAIEAIDLELKAVVRDGVSAKELAESRQYVIGSMPRALETNAGIAQFLQTAEFFGLGLDFDRRVPALLGAVTLDDVVEVARRYLLPELATVVIAGPYPSR